MKDNVVILGYPMPGYSQHRTEAFGYRTLQIVEQVTKKFNVLLLTANKKLTSDYNRKFSNLEYFEFEKFSINEISKLIFAFNPSALISISISNSIWATEFASKYPIWMDIYGDPITEDQIGQHYAKGFFGKLSARKFLQYIIKKGDKFSAVSSPQKYCLIGELALVGRLNYASLGYEFVDVIYPGINKLSNSNSIDNTAYTVNEHDFKIIWSGGYNAWSDPETLFFGLEKAMSVNNKVRFISTGGPVVTESKYEKLLSLISTSNYKSNFLMLGWQDNVEDVYRLWSECDYGIVTDIKCYETEIGSRTRVFDKLGYNLPVIISSGSEIADLVEKYNVGAKFLSQDIDDLAKKVLELSYDRSLRQKFVKNIPKFLDEFSFEKTTEGLLKWLENPTFAPDKILQYKYENIYDKAAYLRRWLKWKLLKKY